MAGQCGKFCIRLGKTVKHLEQLALLLPWEKNRPLVVFKIVVEDCKCAGCPVTGYPCGNKNNSQNHRLIVWNMPVKCHGRLQCVCGGSP
jgi:hypothetical protein